MRPLILLSMALAVAACAEDLPANEVRASGHVEARAVRLAAEVGGRVVQLDVKEGDRVAVGAQIAKLDPRDVELALQRARAEHGQAEAQYRLTRAGSRQEDIRQAEAQAQAVRDEAQAARSELTSAETDFERFESLLRANAGSRKQRDDAATRRDVARDRVRMAESRVRAAEQAVAKLEAGARPEEIDAARAKVAAAAAQVATVEKSLGDTTLSSPVAGVVTEKLAEVGEVIGPRTAVVVITDLDHAYADVFVPEPVVPRIRLGQPATVFTDAGGSGIPGIVSYISPKAEFTPRNVQTAEERSKLVYRVRIDVDNREGVLKEGMPIEAVVPLQALP